MSPEPIKAVVQRVTGLTLAGKARTGHWTMMDTSVEVGGSSAASTPMELVLMALGGCTGMDVLSILAKMGQPVEDYRIELEGERSEEHPKVYTKIRLTHVVKGKVDPERLAHAIELSETKYCSVSGMLKKSVNIETNYRVEP
ncbi:OsmC family protein [bacterium]|nr:OsmC family protein [bacterium]